MNCYLTKHGDTQDRSASLQDPTSFAQSRLNKSLRFLGEICLAENVGKYLNTVTC